MNREERAKQFMAFDALKGLKEELKRREEKMLRIKKEELSEEKIQELSQKIATAKKGDRLIVTFYFSGYYVRVCGDVQEINSAYKYLKVCDNKIAFEDISDMEKIYE